MSYTNYHIVPEQSAVTVEGRGGTFYRATRYNIEIGNNATIMLSSQPNGVGKISVDDIVEVTARDCAGDEFANYRHDFSNGCSEPINPIDPVNLTTDEGFDVLRGKTVSVEIKLLDLCGGGIYSTDFYFCVSES
ncbi:MAG: hypothetical protein AAF611_10605 [Bacteroidota bacterium]